MSRFLTFLYLAFLHSAVSTAAVTINMVESGGDVVATATGSLNIAGLTPTARGSTVVFEGTFRGSLGFAALDGSIFVGQGGGSVDEYIIETTHAFSTGPLWVSQASTGDHVGIISRSDMGDSITLPSGYSSGESISATSTWPGATLAAMQAIPGTYVFSWSGDSLTLNIGPPPTYTVGGTISGLNGGVTLQNSGGDNLVRSTNSSFTFGTAVAVGSTYAVTVFAQPTGQTCSVSNDSGTIVSSNVSNVSVSCVTDSVPGNVFRATLPDSARIGTLSFISSDPGCAFAEDPRPQFLPEASATPRPPKGVSAIDGVVQFTIEGCATGATVLISMDYGVTLPPKTTYWKVANPWYPLTNATVVGSVVRFSITDGGPRDDDPLDGRISDPSGAVLAPDPATGPTANAIPTLSGWAIVLLSMLLGLLVFFRREQPA